MQVDLVKTGTANLVNDKLTIPIGARTIDLINTGENPATFQGVAGVGDLPSAPVILPEGGAYSFGDVNKPYNIIVVNAVGTSVDITVNY